MKSDYTLDPIQVTSVGSLVNLEGDGVGIYAALKIYLWKSDISVMRSVKFPAHWSS